ncbi:MAG: hypothetical protein JW747_05845 [Candidatus Aminicenantes bacterium]|nr:hypothetical protein [Candidatus Aminicenantes bacterium]
MSLTRMLLPALALLFGPARAGWGQTEASQVNRSDFAAAYVRFERTLLSVPLNEAAVAGVNRDFDALSLKFLMGRHGEAVKRLHELTISLDRALSSDPQAAAVSSLRARLEPSAFLLGGKDSVELHLMKLYAVPEPKEEGWLTVRLTGSSPEDVHSFPFQVDWQAVSYGKLVYPVDHKAWRLQPGRYEVALVTERGNAFLSSSWSVVSRPPVDVLRENALRLERIRVESPALVQALASTAARNRLLVETAVSESTTRWTLDLDRLRRELNSEIRELEQGRNPFRGRKGDTWRVLRHGGEEIPFRVFLSESADLSRVLPLVVAFHGAGGDENMFLEGYGSGILKRLADQRKFLLVTPRTPPFMGAKGAGLFEALVGVLGRDYPLDTRRIYVVGHSLGGLAVNGLLARDSGKIAAACCLCGFQGFGPEAKNPPPVLVVAAELDPIAPPSRLEPAARRATEAGHSVEFRLVKGFGHTLAVGRVMADVLDWLFRR